MDKDSSIFTLQNILNLTLHLGQATLHLGLTPVIPALWEAKVGGQITRSGVRDNPGQFGETRSLLKLSKICQVWWQGPIVPATREAKAENCLNLGGRGCS